MAIDTNDPVLQDILQALYQDDGILTNSKAALIRASSEHSLALARYQTVRDYAWRRLECDPYQVAPLLGITMPSGGRYRFVGMSPGDAAVLVLSETTSMSLDEIVKAVRESGLVVPDARTLNAALIRKSGVSRDDEGRYFRTLRVP